MSKLKFLNFVLFLFLAGCLAETASDEVAVNIGPPCVDGEVLAIFTDDDSDGDFQDYQGEIVAWSDSTITAEENYNYYSASAHPIYGPAPAGFQANIYFFYGSDGLTLNMFFGVDEGGTAEWNDVDIEVLTSKNDLEDSVMVSDDPGELFVDQIIGTATVYRGEFSYIQNTDGGTIGPFIGQDYEIRVQGVPGGNGWGNNNSSTFHSANGTTVDIFGSGPVPRAFELRFDRTQVCDANTNDNDL